MGIVCLSRAIIASMLSTKQGNFADGHDRLEVWPESQFAKFLALSNKRIIVAFAVMMYSKRPNDPFTPNPPKI